MFTSHSYWILPGGAEAQSLTEGKECQPQSVASGTDATGARALRLPRAAARRSTSPRTLCSNTTAIASTMTATMPSSQKWLPVTTTTIVVMIGCSECEPSPLAGQTDHDADADDHCPRHVHRRHGRELRGTRSCRTTDTPSGRTARVCPDVQPRNEPRRRNRDQLDREAPQRRERDAHCERRVVDRGAGTTTTPRTRSSTGCARSRSKRCTPGRACRSSGTGAAGRARSGDA